MATTQDATSDPRQTEERRILIIGKTGHGKSATANTILGKYAFKLSGYAGSETERCKYKTSVRFGKTVAVVDTPGVFDTKPTHTDKYIRQELIRSCSLLSPGPHAVLLVYKTGERYTEENQEAVQKYFRIFGKELSNYLFLILSHWDQKPPDCWSPGFYIHENGEELIKLKDRCNGGCYVIINKHANTTEENDRQVKKILRGIDDNLEKMKVDLFTNNVFRVIEACIFVERAASAIGGQKTSYPSIPESKKK